MSNLDWDAWIERSPALAKVNPASLGEALADFRLGGPTAGLGWLARAIQGVFVLTVPVLKDIESPVTDECCVVTVPNATEAKRAYKKLSRAADALLIELTRNSDLLAYRLLTPDLFVSLYGQVERAAETFGAAANNSARLPPRWRQKRVRNDRVERATLLSPIFEAAYDRKPAVNKYPGSDGGPWPDFYQRIVKLVFGDANIHDRDGILDEARRIDARLRVTFAPGQIPEYPL